MQHAVSNFSALLAFADIQMWHLDCEKFNVKTLVEVVVVVWHTFDSILRTSKCTMTTKNSSHATDEFARFFQQKIDNVRAATALTPPPPTANIATEFLESWTEI